MIRDQPVTSGIDVLENARGRGMGKSLRAGAAFCQTRFGPAARIKIRILWERSSRVAPREKRRARSKVAGAAEQEEQEEEDETSR